MGGLLRDALRKDPQYPFAIFLDVNLPGSPGSSDETRWITEWEQGTLPSLSKEEWAKFNLVVCTSFPHHYAKEDEPVPRTSALAYASPSPAFPVPSGVLKSLAQSAALFGSVPAEFPAR
jgi:hypothetical protein